MTTAGVRSNSVITFAAGLATLPAIGAYLVNVSIERINTTDTYDFAAQLNSGSAIAGTDVGNNTGSNLIRDTASVTTIITTTTINSTLNFVNEAGVSATIGAQTTMTIVRIA